MTEISKKEGQAIAWYRTPVDSPVLKNLHQRSDWKGLLQTMGYLGVLWATGGLVLYGASRWPVGWVVGLIFLNGMGYAFLINAVHELGHGTVFRTKWLNALFTRIFAFLGWINFEMFNASHIRHHRYTLHPPEDLEVVLPLKIMVRHFFLQGFINLGGAWTTFRETVRIATNHLQGPWELKLFPEGSPERRAPVRWARILLVGHGLIIGVSLWMGWWLVPVVVTLAPAYGGWLFFLCNNTQHIGLQDNVSDFRLCCRTFTLNPVVQFLYWHMNFHTEHHMYAAVPCYNLGRLHRLIRHDLPPCPHGLIQTWREIAEIQRMQDLHPGYQYSPSLPGQSLAPDEMRWQQPASLA